MSYQTDFITNLKYYRGLRGYSQAKLAELCNCQPGTIGCIESSRQYPSFDLLFKISDVLEINPADLFIRNASTTATQTRRILQEDLIDTILKFVNQKF